jgi:hypothetical protein
MELTPPCRFEIIASLITQEMGKHREEFPEPKID